MIRIANCWLLGAVFTLVLASAAPAQTSAGKSGDVTEAQNQVEEIWGTSAILEMAVKNLAKRYNLNEEQTAYTHEMMTTRVNGFIKDHRADVWPLLRDLMMLQRDGAVPSEDTARRLGPVALKIIEEAKGEIYSSNEEWRDILTPDQKRMHDWDLREMDKTFETMETNFESWRDGQPDTEEIFPTESRSRKRPRKPAKPGRTGTYHPSRANDLERDDQFDLYVKKFTKDYVLKSDQIEAANSILREIKQRAASFRQNNSEKISEIREKLTKPKVSERAFWDKKRRELMKPIRDLFAEMKSRLDKIPDDAQRERFDRKAERTAKPGSAVSSARSGRSQAGGDEPTGKEDK